MSKSGHFLSTSAENQSLTISCHTFSLLDLLLVRNLQTQGSISIA